MKTTDGISASSGEAPVVVFGTGGSGTRAVATFLSACGVEMGRRVNISGDALAFTDILNTYIDEVIATTHELDYDAEQVKPELRSAIIEDYRQAAKRHRKKMARDARWGFKHPRTLFSLPFVDKAFPDALYVHVVRDGRDMLLSRNQNQSRKHFESLFGRPFDETASEIARFWVKTNAGARAFGMRVLKDRYIVVRIEDLCGPEQEREIARLATFLRIEPLTAARWAGEFQQQESFGRGEDLSGQFAGFAEFLAALSTFGYA